MWQPLTGLPPLLYLSVASAAGIASTALFAAATVGEKHNKKKEEEQKAFSILAEHITVHKDNYQKQEEKEKGASFHTVKKVVEKHIIISFNCFSGLDLLINRPDTNRIFSTTLCVTLSHYFLSFLFNIFL